MKLKLDNLPEKDFFSLEEIADRWSDDDVKTDVKTIENYIYEKKTLNLALDFSKFPKYLCEITSDDYESINAIQQIAREIYSKNIDPNDFDGTNEWSFFVETIFEEDWVKDDELNQLVKKINREKLKEKTIPIAHEPNFLYKSELIEQDSRLALYDSSNSFYITARDLHNKHYLFFNSFNDDDFPGTSLGLMLINPSCFNIISRSLSDLTQMVTLTSS